MKTLIVIPAYNESQTIDCVISDIRKHVEDVDILVINDCSTDDTEEKLKNAKDVLYINNLYNLGYAKSIQTGIKYAKENGYDYVVQMDADGQHLATEVNKLISVCKKEKSDIVIGSRYYEGSNYKSPLFRKIGTALFRKMVLILGGKRINDPLSGFQCLGRKAIEYYSIYDNYPKYPDAGLVIEVLMKGFKISETPVEMAKRQAGVSMHSGFIQPIEYMITQLYTCLIIFIKAIGRRK